MAQIVRAFGKARACEVGGAGDNRQAKRRRQPHRDHVGGDELAEPNAGIKALGREVDQLLACCNLNFDLGIGLTEGGDQRLQQDRHHRAWHRET